MKSVRSYVWAAMAAALLGGAAAAQAQDPAAPAGAESTAELPVTRVVLFTSGVGYFEHAGTVSGSQILELSVGTEAMDDILQSLVLQDLDGGAIRPVRYPSRDPLGRILQSFDLDLSADPTLADLLAQARGEVVAVEGAATVEGAIVSVERVEREEGPETYLTLSTDDGLVRLPLAEVRRIRFLDDALQAELEAALGALAEFRSDDSRSVRLAFEGEGERRVRVGYVREMPVWKTSYRLVLDGDGTADLQGWAIFDNPTDMDLRDVELAFVAGQPISFVTGLYEPVYVDRPRVEVSTAPSIVPPETQEAFADSERRTEADAAAEAAPPMGAAMMAPQAAPRLADVGVEAMAAGERTGATFVYRVSTPVTVGRHESAMVPIVQQAVDAHSLSIFDPSVLAGRPLRGVRIQNDTGLHLAAGPVTVFDEGGFTGNARVADVLPGDARILSFAVDLELRVDVSGEQGPERITAVRIQNGTLVTEVRRRIATTYRIDGSAPEDRFLVVDHAKRDGFQVVAPEPAPAETPDAYRFGVLVTAGASAESGAATAGAEDPEVPTHLRCAAGEACVLEVVLERVESRQIAVANVTPDQLVFYLENVELSDDDRATLERILELKREIVALDRQIADLDTTLFQISEEQNRIRQNMDALDRNSSLYRRYVSDLEAQEDRIDQIQAELASLRDARAELQTQLDALIAQLQSG